MLLVCAVIGLILLTALSAWQMPKPPRAPHSKGRDGVGGVRKKHSSRSGVFGDIWNGGSADVVAAACACYA